MVNCYFYITTFMVAVTNGLHRRWRNWRLSKLEIEVLRREYFENSRRRRQLRTSTEMNCLQHVIILQRWGNCWINLQEQILEATDSDAVESKIVDTGKYSNDFDTILIHFSNFITTGQNHSPSSSISQSSYQEVNIESSPFRTANVDNATPFYTSSAAHPQTDYYNGSYNRLHCSTPYS